MCGRFDCHAEISVIEKLFKIDRLSIDYQPHYNIAPSQNIVIIRGLWQEGTDSVPMGVYSIVGQRS